MLKQMITVITTAVFFLLSISVAEAVSYKYDSLNRMTEVLYDTNEKIVYEYDAVGNMTAIKSYFIKGNINYLSWPKAETVTRKKEWTITFNKVINPETINMNTVYAIDAAGNKVETKLELLVKDKAVKITPTGLGYKIGEEYMLIVEREVQDENEESLENPVLLRFEVSH